MLKKSSKWEFLGLLTFLICLTLLFTNGFSERIFAQDTGTDVYQDITPIGDVLSEIMKSYYKEPDVNEVVEGALKGMMNSLDRNSSYISPDLFEELTEETQGEFDGIGVHITLDDNDNLTVLQPVADAPAAEAGIMTGDFITAIDGVPTKGMSILDAAKRIKGPRNTIVHLSIYREGKNGEDGQKLEFDVKRGKIPLESIREARVLDGGIGYIRISDFKKNTAREIKKEMARLADEGMKSLVLDLRWNPGGLLTASQDVSELFLPRGNLVTYTKGRETGDATDNLRLETRRTPVLPLDFPMVLIVNGSTASSSEIVTGALQYYKRAIVIGEQTYGKGSVQTIIQLAQPKGSALRLTTALYYTPAGVTIHNMGIRPDIEVAMDEKDSVALFMQMYRSYAEGPDMRDHQDHGSITGDEVTEETVEDIQLAKAVEILQEEGSFQSLVDKYHKDTRITQVAAPENGGPPRRDIEADIPYDDGGNGEDEPSTPESEMGPELTE